MENIRKWLARRGPFRTKSTFLEYTKCDFGNVVGPAILTPLIILTKSAHFFINFWQIEIMKS